MSGSRYDVFGRRVLVIREDNRWRTFYLGDEGKRRPAADIIIPAGTPEAELQRYLADLCHEWASAAYPDVKPLK